MKEQDLTNGSPCQKFYPNISVFYLAFDAVNYAIFCLDEILFSKLICCICNFCLYQHTCITFANVYNMAWSFLQF